MSTGRWREQDTKRLVLASQSPRRLVLLQQLGFDPVVAPTALPEVKGAHESPGSYVRRLAREKAMMASMDWEALCEARAAAQLPAAAPLILAADTTVVLDGEVMEKPADAADALRMLELLSGKTHEVLTGIALVDLRADGHATWGVMERLVTTLVEFGAVDAEDIRRYVATGEPMDKAGAYGIQGLAGGWVKRIVGSYPNVVGLPVYEVIELLLEAGAIKAFPWPVGGGGA
jgi:septum formation protein